MWTVHIGYDPLAHLCIITDRNPTLGITTHQLLDTITKTDTADQGHSPIPTDITVTVTMVPTESFPGHITETVDATIGVLCNAITPAHIVFAMTPHIKDHPNIGVHQLT